LSLEWRGVFSSCWSEVLPAVNKMVLASNFLLFVVSVVAVAVAGFVPFYVFSGGISLAWDVVLFCSFLLFALLAALRQFLLC